MAVIPGLWRLLFGNGRNVVAETVGIFQENEESGAARDAPVKGQAMSQFAAEFAQPRKGLFDRAIDGLNRLPRPLLAFGTIGLFVMAMVDPIWFASRMQGIALVPEPLWWLMGAIVRADDFEHFAPRAVNLITQAGMQQVIEKKLGQAAFKLPLNAKENVRAAHIQATAEGILPSSAETSEPACVNLNILSTKKRISFP